MHINNEINKNKNLKENLKTRLLIIPVIIIGLGVVFLPADLFSWFIFFISIIIIPVGAIELFFLGEERLRLEFTFRETTQRRMYIIQIVTFLMIFYFIISILIFSFFSSGFKIGNAQGWYLLMLAPAGLQDALAYGVGVTIGKHKILALKNISSNKTWEGTFFGMMAGFSLAMIILRFYFSYLELWQMLFTAVLIAVFSFFGDLLESKFKRILGVKDSGTIMKGHGGLLDRIDSQLLTIYGVFLLTFWFL